MEERTVVKEKINKDHPELKEIWSEYFALRGSLERKGLNYRIQGLAGNQTKMAGILIRKRIIEENLQGKLTLTNMIHDEVLCEVDIDFQEEGRKIVEEAMVQGANFFSKTVRMSAEAIITPYWHH